MPTLTEIRSTPRPAGADAPSDLAPARPGATRCPACGSSALTPGITVDAARAAQHFVRRHLDPVRHDALRAHIDALWPEGTATVLACGGCGMHFADPLVGGDARFYNLAYPGDPVYPSDRWEYGRTLAALEDSARPLADLAILEVGAGDGTFLDRLVAAGANPERVSAFEFNDHSLARLAGKGFAASATSFTDIAPDRPFDLIFMFQVLEHLDRPEQVFARLREYLAPGGRAFVGVPNPARIAFNEASDSLPDMPPNHVTRWSPQAFERFAGRHGLRVVATEVEPGTARDFLVRDIGYRYLRGTMEANSLAARTYRRRGDVTEKAMRLAVAAGLALGRVPLWLATLPRVRELGTSLWAELERPAEPGPG